MAKAKPMSGLMLRLRQGKMLAKLRRFRLEEMYEWEKYVDNPYDVRKLHDLRIAAKRLRYTLEIFEDALPEGSQQVVKELTHVQDEIGALHDSDVLIALLRLCLGSQDGGEGYEDCIGGGAKTTYKEGFYVGTRTGGGSVGARQGSFCRGTLWA